MKKISIMIMVLVVALASCKKTPEVNLKYVDVERDLVTVGTTTANIQCDYEYIATLKKAYLYYGEGQDEANMTSAEMRVVQNTLYVELIGLRENTTYNYFYEFHNGFNSMRTALKSFKTEASPGGVTLPTVVTAAVTEITTNSAQGGGEVTDDGGAEVTERGICWSTNANPTLNNNHIASGTGAGAFTAAMSGLEANTTYQVRAYAINEKGTAYGLDREFVTIGGGNDCDYDYVDLGLPSGTLWATCNVGANLPEEYGDYFAWGETEMKTIYTFETYKYCNGNQISITKYCNNPNYGYNGYTDALTALESEDDAAMINWCDDWCMPTVEQYRELLENTESIWTTINDVSGRLFTASNGNAIFLPAAGFLTRDIEAQDAGIKGYYWSKSLFTDPDGAWKFGFYGGDCELVGHNRADGFSIRPVLKNDSPIPPGNVPEGAINSLFTINENGDQVYFSQGNLQYQASTNTWRFAENQWDYVGGVDEYGVEMGNVYNNSIKCDNSLVSSFYDGWIDLFGWGTSGYHDPNDPYNVNYQPWSTSISHVNDSYNTFGYGPSTNTSAPSLIDASANYDWGIYNPISNGGNRYGQWRTLTMEEWFYVLKTRVTSSGICYAYANVNTVDCLILLPDDWDNSVYTFSVDYSSNIITALQWIDLENAGAVLLPIAGRRYEDSFKSGCGYWSTSCYYSHSAYGVYFSTLNIFPQGSESRFNGRSVRLVQDANPQNKAR